MRSFWRRVPWPSVFPQCQRSLDPLRTTHDREFENLRTFYDSVEAGSEGRQVEIQSPEIFVISRGSNVEPKRGDPF